MYLACAFKKCTTVLLIYDEATFHAAGNEMVGITFYIAALEA